MKLGVGEAAAIALLLAAGPARAAEPEQLLGGRVESLLEFARERHPEFAALRADAESAAARIEPAGALPDPRLRTELRDVTNEGRDASANLLPPRIGSARYSFSQTLPWPRRCWISNGIRSVPMRRW